MRNLKKFLALVLAMIMAMSLMITADAKVVNSTGFADETTYAQTGAAGYAEFDEAIAVLTGMGVIKGDKSGADGASQFRPTENLTRAEAAALIYRVLTGDVNDNQAKLFVDVQTNLTDVTADKWYAGYVGYLWNAKIIKGRLVGDSYVFDASAKVTGYEVLTMMLRAIGWGRNGEFEGATWQITASSTAKVEGVLNLISNTAFESTLWQPARRDVTAAIIFSGLTNAIMVDYVAPGQYSKTSMIQNGTGGIASQTANPTLGVYRFGLASMEGIIVGNSETLEDRTLLSRSYGFTYDGTLGLVTKGWNGNSYEHDITNVANGNQVNAAASTTVSGTTVTQFDLGTGLNLFGHKVRMWYDNGSGTGTAVVEDDQGNSTGFTARYTKGYVAYDLAVMDEVIFADDVSLTSGGVNPTVYNGAINRGFADNGGVYESDRYGRLTKDNAGTAGQMDSESEVGLYRVIANDNKKFNVVIALNQEVATITQVNTTDLSYGGQNYIVLGNGSASQNAILNGGNGYSDFGYQDRRDANNSRGIIISDQLVGAINVEKAKAFVNSGKPVIATEIVGTKVAAATNDPTDYVYSIEELAPAFTGTIASYVMNATGNLIGVMTLSSTERYSLSGITGSGGNDWSFPGSVDSNYQYSHLVNGLTPLTGATNVNVTYTFYTDAAGRVIGVKVPNDYGFIYATFADYEIGALGTGTSGYYIYGVNWDGEKVLDKKLSTINLPLDLNGNNVGNSFDFSDVYGAADQYTDVNGTDHFTQYVFPNGGGWTLGDGYSLLPITMKNQGSSNVLTSNQIKAGGNTRFLLDSEGNLDWFDNGSGQYGRRFNGWFDSNVTNQRSETWTITATDAANGFLRVYNQEFDLNSNVNLADQGVDNAAITTDADNIGYVLTNNTKFHVVTGSGTADLNVEHFTGLSGLLNGDSGAEITLEGTDDNVYFLTSEDKYGNADTTANRTIDTVILSSENLKRFTSKNVYFSAPGNGEITGSQLVGGNSNIVLYELYTNGVLGSYWIDKNASTDGAGTYQNGPDGAATYGSFYTLAKINTINGTPVYRATPVAADGDYNKTTTGAFTGSVNKADTVNDTTPYTYNYVAVNELNTAEIGNKVFTVTGATVTEAFGTNTPSAHNEINSLSTLNWAVAKFSNVGSGVGENQFTVSVAFVYDGIRVSNIYVIDVQQNW